MRINDTRLEQLARHCEPLNPSPPSGEVHVAIPRTELHELVTIYRLFHATLEVMADGDRQSDTDNR